MAPNSDTDPLAAAASQAPRTVRDVPSEFWELGLVDAIHLAVNQSQVMRDIGARVTSVPAAAVTRFDPAIRDTDPVFGSAAALSAFDASLSSQFFFQNNDRVFNNRVLGGGAQELTQDLATYQTQLSKVAATGTRFALRSTTLHDHNNRDGNLFNHVWETQNEAEIQQPLLQGAGLEFNRIAGPNAAPGLNFSNGVLIARINTSISLADFELAVRNMVADVEEAYWQLVFAYRDFDSKQAARDATQKTWNMVQAKYEQQIAGGEADKEAQARAQFYYYQDLTLQALNGSGSSPGIYDTERRLRAMLGLPLNDGRLIRPTDQPPTAPTIYDWPMLSTLAVAERVELRRQRWTVKQEELRLCAAKNFLLPRLDAIARYRLRGFGDDLAGQGPRFASAWQDMSSGDHQEWEFGLQFNVTMGQRRAYAALRNAQLQLAREEAILREQQFQITNALGQAVARCEQAQASIEASFQRLLASEQRTRASEVAYEADQTTVDLLLEAQEQLFFAQSRFHEAQRDYAIALKNVNLESGQLLKVAGVCLQEDTSGAHCWGGDMIATK